MTDQLESFKPLLIVVIISVFVFFLAVIIPLGYSLFGRLGVMLPRSFSSGKSLQRTEDPETPMELLTHLYDAGEITQKEFDAVKKELELYVVGKKTKDEFEMVKHDIEHFKEEKASKNGPVNNFV